MATVSSIRSAPVLQPHETGATLSSISTLDDHFRSLSRETSVCRQARLGKAMMRCSGHHSAIIIDGKPSARLTGLLIASE
jgi:hypothetical protein